MTDKDQSTPKPEEKKQPAAKSKKIPALFIRSVSKLGFRRAGFAFTPDGFGIAIDALTKEQIKALKEESQLIVKECEIDATEIADAQ